MARIFKLLFFLSFVGTFAHPMQKLSDPQILQTTLKTSFPSLQALAYRSIVNAIKTNHPLCPQIHAGLSTLAQPIATNLNELCKQASGDLLEQNIDESQSNKTEDGLKASFSPECHMVIPRFYLRNFSLLCGLSYFNPDKKDISINLQRSSKITIPLSQLFNAKIEVDNAKIKSFDLYNKSTSASINIPLPPPPSPIKKIFINPAYSHAFIITQDTIYPYDIIAQQRRNRVTTQLLDISPDGKYFLTKNSQTNDIEIRSSNTHALQPMYAITCPNSVSALFHAKEDCYSILTKENILNIRDLKTGNQIKKINSSCPLKNITMDKNGYLIAECKQPDQLWYPAIFNLGTGDYQIINDKNALTSSTCINKDATLAFYKTNENLLIIWSFLQTRRIKTYEIDRLLEQSRGNTRTLIIPTHQTRLNNKESNLH